jgi:LDH2 family malate/lactate/ureidoglycolate dehydrogenase
MAGVRSGLNVSIDQLESFCEQILRGLGVSEPNARTTSDVLVQSEAWGIATHGVKLLRGYARRLRAGGLRGDASPELVKEGLGWAVIDGRSALGQVTTKMAMETAIAKARRCGSGFVTIRNSCHFGAAGYYAWLAARQGMFGMAMANDVPSVAAPGSKGAILGSNPIAYSIPIGNRDPILLDMSIATVAGGKVMARVNRGEPIPAGWLVDSEGRPTQRGELYPHSASLAPMGGHKGYGIGLLIEILSGVLSGAAFTTGVGSWLHGDRAAPTNHGAAVMAIDIAAMRDPAEFANRMEALQQEIHEAPAAEGSPPLMLPGEMEWKNFRRAKTQGLELLEDVVASLEETADECGQSSLMSVLS